jgi:hypothetical protein
MGHSISYCTHCLQVLIIHCPELLTIELEIVLRMLSSGMWSRVDLV